MEAATRRTWSLVSCLTASGRENARDTVDLWTPAAAATSSMLGVDTSSPLLAVRVRVPDDGHRGLEIADPRELHETTCQLRGHLVYEQCVQWVAVHVDERGLRKAFDGGERRTPVGPDGGGPRGADPHEGAVPLERRPGERVSHLDGGDPSVGRGQRQRGVVLDAAAVQRRRQACRHRYFVGTRRAEEEIHEV